MKELTYIPYAFAGFSFAQLLGIVATYGLSQQVTITALIFAFIALIPGFMYYGSRQSKTDRKLSWALILSCFIPSFVVIGLLIFGITLGVYVAS